MSSHNFENKDNELPIKKRELTFEEETIESLKQAIDIYCQQPLPLSKVSTVYMKHTNRPLELSKLGYDDINKFLSEKLSKHISIRSSKNEYMVISRAAVNQPGGLSSSESDDDESVYFSEVFENLKKDVKKVLADYVNKNLTFNTFTALYEKKMERPFNFRDYNHVTIEQMLRNLVKSDTIAYSITDGFQYIVRLLPESRQLITNQNNDHYEKKFAINKNVSNEIKRNRTKTEANEHEVYF